MSRLSRQYGWAAALIACTALVPLSAAETIGGSPFPVTYIAAAVETNPDHITPIWRGFKGRQREHPALVTFTEVSGWRVGQFGGTEAAMVRSEEEPCYEDLRYQAKLTYQSRDGTGHFELIPPKPIPITGSNGQAASINAACAWVYGNNWAWVPDPKTPPVHVWVRLSDAAGQWHRIDLGVVNFKFYGWLSKRLRDKPGDDPGHRYWGGPADGRIRLPAQLEAIEIRGGTNREPRTIYLESVAFYQDNMDLPTFHPDLIDHLPFPTSPDTILPTVAKPTEIALEQEDRTFVFTAQGDEDIVWRYTPATGTLSDLSVQIASRPAFKPCAGGGPVYQLGTVAREPADAALQRDLLEVKMTNKTVTTRWRFSCDQAQAEFTIKLRAQGKSLIVDWSAATPNATALRLGKAQEVIKPKTIRVPYLAIQPEGPAVLLANNSFFITLLDWYNTQSSEFYTQCGLEGDRTAVVNGGSLYYPLTDGSRNSLGERQFINVSSRFDEVLPNIPNPPSTQARVSREHLYSHLGGNALDRFDKDLKMWREYHRKGIRKVMVSHHEDAWSNGADVGQGGQEYTMCVEAAPEIGDEKLIAYCRAMREMGYYIGLYENFTDYNPLGKSWDERNAARTSFGELRRVWPPAYAIRPLKALEMALDYPRRVRKKFSVNTAYRDCHTAYPPWGQVDYQAGSPGAGKFAVNFRAWGALLRDGSKAYNGPIFSEGGYHWFSAGLVDGNYAQIWMPDATHYPLLLDFDLLKIHPLETDISMTPGWVWGQGVWHCLAATIAYGHIGFQPFGDLALAARYYYLMQQLQARYAMIPVKEIRYHRDGQFYDVTEALKTDAHAANQVRIRYANGLEVAVNCNPKKDWKVTLSGKSFDLRGYAWAAVAPDGFVEYSTEIAGRRVSYVDAPAYCFADGGGQRFDFGPIATDGALVVQQDDRQKTKLIPLAQVTSVTWEVPEDSRLEARDEFEKSLGEVSLQRDGARITFTLVPGAEDYLLRP